MAVEGGICRFLAIKLDRAGHLDEVRCTHPNAQHGSKRGLIDGPLRVMYEGLGEELPETVSAWQANYTNEYYACIPALNIRLSARTAEQMQTSYDVEASLLEEFRICPGYRSGGKLLSQPEK